MFFLRRSRFLTVSEAETFKTAYRVCKGKQLVDGIFHAALQTTSPRDCL